MTSPYKGRITPGMHRNEAGVVAIDPKSCVVGVGSKFISSLFIIFINFLLIFFY